MKRYRTLLFDADDTILDFQAAEALALRLLFEDQNIFLTNDMKAQYKTINQGLWRAFEEGKMTRDEVETRVSPLCSRSTVTKRTALCLSKNTAAFLKKDISLLTVHLISSQICSNSLICTS